MLSTGFLPHTNKEYAKDFIDYVYNYFNVYFILLIASFLLMFMPYSFNVMVGVIFISLCWLVFCIYILVKRKTITRDYDKIFLKHFEVKEKW